MIDAPQITHSPSQLTAFIHLTVPFADLPNVMGPGISEVMAALRDQGIPPAGPWFTHQLRMDPDAYDFEICVPLATPVSAVGRVGPGQLPAARVARTVFQGPYEGLPAAWEEFQAWIAERGLDCGPDLWEVYVAGPESGPDPSAWRTELNRPLVG